MIVPFQLFNSSTRLRSTVILHNIASLFAKNIPPNLFIIVLISCLLKVS